MDGEIVGCKVASRNFRKQSGLENAESAIFLKQAPPIELYNRSTVGEAISTSRAAYQGNLSISLANFRRYLTQQLV